MLNIKLFILKEKAFWIEAIERATQVSNEIPPSPSKSIGKCDFLTSFPLDVNVFCALQYNGMTLVGTSDGLYISEEQDDVKPLKQGPESVFQMEYIEAFDELVMVLDSCRKLTVVKGKDIKRLVDVKEVNSAFKSISFKFRALQQLDEQDNQRKVCLRKL